MLTHIVRVLVAAFIIAAPLKLIGGKFSRPYICYSAVVAYSYVPLLLPALGYMIGAAVLPAESYTSLLSTLSGIFVNKTVFAAIMGGIAPFMMSFGIKFRETFTLDPLSLLYVYAMSAVWIMMYFLIPFV